MLIALIALFLILFIGEGLILNGAVPTGILLVVCSTTYSLHISSLIKQNIFLEMLLDKLWHKWR